MKEIEDLVQLFKWQRIDDKEYFFLQATSKEAGQACFDTLKENLSQYDFVHHLKWEPEKLRISLPIKAFVEWQRHELSLKYKNIQRIHLKNRIFYQRDNSYFTIAIKNECAMTLRTILLKNNFSQKIKFDIAANSELGVAEFSANEYEKYMKNIKVRERIFTKDRVVYKDFEKNCFYYTPNDGETLFSLKRKLRNYLLKRFKDKDVDIHLNVNNEKHRVEISEELYKLMISNKDKKCKPKSTCCTKRTFHENEKYFYTYPEDTETLDGLYNQFVNYFRRLHVDLNIKVHKAVNDNFVYIAKEEYEKWRLVLVQNKKNAYRNLTRAFKFNKETNHWENKIDQQQKILIFSRTLRNACKRYELDPKIFLVDVNTIKITDKDFQDFKNKNLKEQASKNIMFGKALNKDDKANVFYYKSNKSSDSARSFNSLAKLLDVNVTFYVKNKRVELTKVDYEKWIANPIIQESLQGVKELQSLEAHSKQDGVTKVRAIVGKPQKASNTKGGISTKYLEGVVIIPFAEGKVEEIGGNRELLSKGHVIAFKTIKEVLEPITDHKRWTATIAINFGGIKGKVTIYKSEKEDIQNILAKKKIVFVRCGRKEEAHIPEVTHDQTTEVLLLVTRSEYEEMEKSLAFNPASKLPQNVKLCVIESCSLQSQPAKQSDSYIRASNIKRAMAFALADGFNINQFILMDDNTTQIQMADKVAQNNFVSDLFKLFRQYKAKGTVCATLGSFEFYKDITRPLEATEPEDIQERLGSKIMYVDYKRIKAKLKSENKKHHELFSPCNLWWGEDYFNMLSILNLMESEEQPGLLGVLPYSVAWHRRSHKNQNKAKEMPNFKMANIWLNIDQEYLKTLSLHHQQVIGLLQNIVKEAIEQQKKKTHNYLVNIDRAIEETQKSDIEIFEKEHERNVLFEQGFKLGEQTAKIGVVLNIDKLKKNVQDSRKLSEKDAEEYIRGFTMGHQEIWDTLSPEERAFGRGYRDGKIAAKQGYEVISEINSKIPECYLQQADIYQQGFKRGNLIGWERMRKAEHLVEVELSAKHLGTLYATTHLEIKKHKLDIISARYGENQHYFADHFEMAFKSKRASMSVDEINQLVIDRAKNLANELSQSTILQLNLQKLHSAASRFGQSHCKLYQETVVSEFMRLRADKVPEKDSMHGCAPHL